MSTPGLSKARLSRMHDVMAGYVERGDVPGLVTLVSRRGEVHVDVIGTQAFAGPTPMRRGFFWTGIFPISDRRQCPKTCIFIRPGTAPRLRQAGSRSKRSNC